MILQCLTVIVICLHLLFDHAQAEDIFLDCPERWTESQEVILHCTVARSKFPNQCRYKKNEMYFIVNKNSRTREKHCTVSSFNCSSSTKLNSGCYCAAENSTLYTFIYKFSASAEYQGTWRCDVFCVDDDGNSVLTYGSSKSCNNVIVDPVASGYFITGQSTAIFVSMIFTVVYVWS